MIRIVAFGECYGPFLTQTNAEICYEFLFIFHQIHPISIAIFYRRIIQKKRTISWLHMNIGLDPLFALLLEITNFRRSFHCSWQCCPDSCTLGEKVCSCQRESELNSLYTKQTIMVIFGFLCSLDVVHMNCGAIGYHLVNTQLACLSQKLFSWRSKFKISSLVLQDLQLPHSPW